MENEMEVKKVRREVIESTLLTSLEDDGTVAVLYGREELTLVIDVLAGRSPPFKAAKDLAADLERLWFEAFAE